MITKSIEKHWNFCKKYNNFFKKKNEGVTGIKDSINSSINFAGLKK